MSMDSALTRVIFTTIFRYLQAGMISGRAARKIVGFKCKIRGHLSGERDVPEEIGLVNEMIRRPPLL